MKPKHYETNTFDVIDFCNVYKLNFNKGSAVKYLARAGLKQYEGMTLKESEHQDLVKAIDFLSRELKYLTTKTK